jgi:hypothetical protein
MPTKASVQIAESDIRIDFHRQISPEVVQDVKQLVMSNFWQRQWSERVAEEIFSWRYRDLHACEMAVAYHGEHLVAMIASYLRPHLIAQELVLVREPSDWFCLPEYRWMGVGLQLMYMLMDLDEPLLAIGGNDSAMTVLPALGWQRFSAVRNYTLPLTTRFFISKASHLLRAQIIRSAAAKLGAISLPKFRQRYGENHSWREVDPTHYVPDMRSAANAYDFLPLLCEQEIEWLYAAPQDLGTFFCLVFPESTGVVTAFALGRLYSYLDLHHAKLIHIHTCSPSVEVYARILGETIGYLQDHKADVVYCRASSPFLRPALRRLGFIGTGLTPAYWWAKDQAPVHGNLHLTFLRGDDAIRPYPE